MSIRFCNTNKKAIEAIKYLQDDIEYLEIDIETFNLQGGSALDPHSNSMRTFQFNSGSGIITLLDLLHVDWEVLEVLHDRLRDRTLPKLAHNAKFEYKVIKRVGKVTISNLECTFLREKIRRNGLAAFGFGLDDVALNLLGVNISKEVRASDWSVPVLSTEQIRYGAKDVKYLKSIFDIQEELMTDNQLAVWQIEKECLPIFADMELTGIKLNTKQVEVAREIAQRGHDKALKKLQKLMPRVPLTKSERNDKVKNKDLTNRVIDKLTGEKIRYPDGFKPVQNLNDFKASLKLMGIKVPTMYDAKSKKQREALTKDTIYFIDHPIAANLVEFNEQNTLLTKYLSKMGGWISPITNRVHTDITQILVTFRISMSAPPMQQIPQLKAYRDLFPAKKSKRYKYKLVKVDYSQLELRVTAEVTRDRGLIEEYSKGLDADLHTRTAIGIFGNVDLEKKDKDGKTPRQNAKAVNFGAIYGQGARGLMQYLWSFKIYKTIEECQEFLDAWFDLYHGVKLYHEQVVGLVKSYVEYQKNPNGQILVNQHGQLRLQRTKQAPECVTITTLNQGERMWEIDRLLDRAVIGGKISRSGHPYIYAICNDMINHPIQGTAGLGTKEAMINVNKHLRKTKLHKEAKIILQVHDELVLEVREDLVEEVGVPTALIMERTMQKYIKRVPIYCDASYGDTWAAGTKIEIVR